MTNELGTARQRDRRVAENGDSFERRLDRFPAQPPGESLRVNVGDPGLVRVLSSRAGRNRSTAGPGRQRTRRRRRLYCDRQHFAAELGHSAAAIDVVDLKNKRTSGAPSCPWIPDGGVIDDVERLGW